MRDMRRSKTEHTPRIFHLLVEIHGVETRGHQIVFNGAHRCRYCGISLALLSHTGESCDSPKYQG